MNNLFDPRLPLSGTYALIARNAGLLIGLQVLQRLLGLVTTYFVVRVLSQDGFGNYQFVLSVVGVVSIFGLPGINNAVMQSVARGHPGTYRISVRPAVLSGLVGSVVLLGVGCWYYFLRGDELSVSFLVAALIFPLAYGLTQWKGLKTGLEDFVGVVRLDGVAAMATSLLIIGTVIYVSDDFAVLVAIILVVQAVLNVVATTAAYRQVQREESVEKGSIRYGTVTTAYMVFGHVAIYVDKLLIYAFMTPASLAIFVAAERFPELIRGAIKNLGSALAPRFARHKYYTRRVARAFTTFSIISGAAIVAFAFTVLPWLLVFIFGEDYQESVPYAQVLMCSVAIASSVPLRGRWIKSQQDAASFRDVNVLIAICRIVASASLIPFFGIKGAVISAVVARTAGVAIIHFVMKKRYPITGDNE
jgi:O-antigen/teichoic acid export membrane protein